VAGLAVGVVGERVKDGEVFEPVLEIGIIAQGEVVVFGRPVDPPLQ